MPLSKDAQKQSASLSDRHAFREFMGYYPTGVSAITAMGNDGSPHGFIVGTFQSVSLDPLLIAITPARTSTTWPVIRETGKFSVNLLAADQGDLCRALSQKGPGKLLGIAHEVRPPNQLWLCGCVAYLDCKIIDEFEAGDHTIAIAKVEFYQMGRDADPLIFQRGKFGSFRANAL